MGDTSKSSDCWEHTGGRCIWRGVQRNSERSTEQSKDPRSSQECHLHPSGHQDAKMSVLHPLCVPICGHLNRKVQEMFVFTHIFSFCQGKWEARLSARDWDDEEGVWGPEPSCGGHGGLCDCARASLSHHRVCTLWQSSELPPDQQENGTCGLRTCSSVEKATSLFAFSISIETVGNAWGMYQYTGFLPQYTEPGEHVEGENPYVGLGNVTSLDLISFAYQIASGMVSATEKPISDQQPKHPGHAYILLNETYILNSFVSFFDNHLYFIHITEPLGQWYL